VRFRRYNSPERGKPGYEEDKAKLEKICLGKPVKVEFKAERVIANVWLNGETLSAVIK